MNEPTVEVRCRMCDFRTTVDRADENSWYETHRCDDVDADDERGVS